MWRTYQANLRKNYVKFYDDPKRHIVLLGKKIIRDETILNKSEHFDQFDDRPPFSVYVDQASYYTMYVSSSTS